MEDGSPALEVGFAIDFGDAFGGLKTLDAVVTETVANAVREHRRLQTTINGTTFAGATASITGFGAAATKEGRNAARELGRIEKAGEGLSRQLERQASTFGKTREQIRAMKVESAALAAEQRGLTELAGRLRAHAGALSAAEFAAMRRAKAEAEALAEAKALGAREAAAAIEREARAAQEATAAYRTFEAVARQRMAIYREQQVAQAAAGKNAEVERLRAEAVATAKLSEEHARLVATVRGSQAAQEADAAAAERLRMSTDPLYAATKRLNAEIAESTRLYHAGATAPAEYARQQQVLTDRLGVAATQHNTLAGSARRSGFALQQFAIQTPDIAQGLLTGQKPMTVFIQQGSQLAQMAMMAEGGVKGFAAELGAFALAAAPVLLVVGALAAGFALFKRDVAQGIDTKAMVNSLGLTDKEIKKLKDTTIGYGDVATATFQIAAENVGLSLGGMGKSFSAAMDWMTKAGRVALAGLYGAFFGTFSAIGVIVKDVFAGKGIRDILADAGNAYNDMYKKADEGLAKFGQRVTDRARVNKLTDLNKQADVLKANRTPKTNSDSHAAQLARENEAIEAQIRNLYKLADAYGISGAAALIAEARVKAETAAIKKRGDIEVFVNRQVRLSIAERVMDAAKSAAAMRDQARVQTEVNGMIEAGTIPAQRANELIQQRMAELPLLAAIEAAQQRGLKKEAEAATRALEGQRNAAADARAAAKGTFYVTGAANAGNQLDQQREELRLIGATDAERVRAMATLRATQEIQAQGYDTTDAYAKQYIADQVAIAAQAAAITLAQDAYNASLTSTADRWDIIAGKVQSAGQGMAEAFGPAGRAIGELATIYSSYQAQRAQADAAHHAQLTKWAGNKAELDRENQRFALQASGAQVAAFGDAAVAAKSFFEEGSSGYRSLAKAEQTFRAIQFALSVRAMAQDAIETGVLIAKSGARAAAHAVEAVARAISSLPFPANLAAGAATAAALAAIGVSIKGAFGGGGGKAAPTNDGSGTVLGDTSAKSASIKNAIDALKEVDTLMLSSSREMAASLKSIDSQIGGFAAQILKAGDINASAGVQTGFKTDATGKVLSTLVDPFGLLSKIPVIGGVFSAVKSLISSLFGSKTQITGSGLYGGAQSLGGVLSGGFDASYYSDVKKTKKFLGITTGTSYSTQYSGADPTLENQFTLILRSFNDAIAAAAGPLGESTAAIQQRLNGFVVDIGKIDLTGLSGEQITEKLTAVFGAAADRMATSAFPDIARFQKAGEGAFETLVRVASTVEDTTAALTQLGASTRNLGIDAKLGLAGQFDSLSALSTAVDGYFKGFYTKEEQAAAKAAQFAEVFGSLGVAAPATLAAFRQLVEAQDLTTAAGQATYATLLQLAPAFADLQASMAGAKSAADIASERQDLQRQLLELAGDTAAIRALDLAKLDASNRGLQEQIYAIQDAQKAAAAADELRKAWTSVGDSITDEVKRIRGLAGGGDSSFVALQGQFNAATAAARGGDQDAAKSLPQLSQAMLSAAALVATSRQELDRVQASTAASLEATKRAIDTIAANPSASATSTAALVAAAAASQAAATPAAANDGMADELRALREEVAGMRKDNNAGHAANASNTGGIKRKLDDVTGSGGDAIDVRQAA